MDSNAVDFASNANCVSVDRLIALSEVISQIPPEKMAKARTFTITWDTVFGELVPQVSMEFFE